MNNSIGKLTRVSLREVWRHEADDLTSWLANNPDVLSEALGVTLTSIEREHTVGTLSADLRAEDEDGSIVVIENQLGRSDHDHVGKLLTYVSALDAKTAVWIVADPRPEHVGAVNWLNQAGSTAFYLLKIEAVRIGDSVPAPLLTRITGPSEEAIEVGKTKKEIAERYLERERFWTELLALAKPRMRLFANISPKKDNWISAGSGISGVTFAFVIKQYDGRVELYIDRGEENQNTRIFEQLAARKDAVEHVFGSPLDWEPLLEKRAYRIRKEITRGGYRSPPEIWPEIQREMVDAMDRLERALRPHLMEIRKGDPAVAG